MRKQFKAAFIHAIALCTGAFLCAEVRAATILQSSGSAHVAFEAEVPSPLINAGSTTWVVTNDSSAIGGSALYIGGTTDNGTSPHSFVQYQIKFATAGTYHLYYRWKADSTRTVADQFTANSAWIPLDFGAISTPGAGSQVLFRTAASNGTQAPANNAYDWQREPDTSPYTVSEEQVNAGAPLVLTIGTREAGMVIDRWVLSPDPNLTDAALEALVNSETSIVTQGSSENFVAFEAETKGTLINGTQTFWIATNDTPASAGGALYIGGTTDNGTSPHSFVQYQVKFSQPGTYNLYYRWKADSTRTVADQFTANSAWIPNMLGDFKTPGAASQVDFHTAAANGTQAPANNVYDWQREADTATYTVTAEEVAAGVPLIFSVGTREAGMVIDRWVFSPDATLTDAALDALPNSGAAIAGPELVRAVGSAALNNVRVFFSRPLAAASVQPGRFTIAGLNVTAAEVNADDPRQVLLTTAAQTQGTEYTVAVTGVTDTSGNAIAPGATVKFSAWKLVEGWATQEIYLNVAGSLVDDLKNAPAFQAGTPDEVRWVKGFQLNNDPRAPNMGAKISALFNPAASGTYNFYINNDDEAELLLSTDQTEAGLQSLGLFPLSPPVFDDAIVAQSPTSLTTGQRYLLNGLVKSGAGDVYLNVAAQPSTSTTPAANLSVLGGARISTFVNPDLGKVTFREQPANVTTTAGARARFAVRVEATEGPVYYQWKVNGVDIPGATRAVYTTPVLSTSDTGKTYSVVVSIAGRDTTSASATLTVGPGEPSNLQPYIGVNFVGGGDNLPGVLSPVDVAGVVPQENWNNLTGFQFDQVPLVNAAGAATPVTLTVEGATEHWYSGTLGARDANGALLQGFIDAGASLETPVTVRLNNVPEGKYNVIVYSVGFPFQASYEEDITLIGSTTQPTYTVKAESGLEFNANPVFRRMTSTSAANRDVGNYVQFDNVAAAPDGSFTVTVLWTSTAVGNTHQPAVNGIQLVRIDSTVVVRPTITTTRDGNTLTLAWTASAAGFTLETSATLGTTANWTPVAGVPNPISAAGSVNVNMSGTTGFYRLRRP